MDYKTFLVYSAGDVTQKADSNQPKHDLKRRFNPQK